MPTATDKNHWSIELIHPLINGHDFFKLTTRSADHYIQHVRIWTPPVLQQTFDLKK